MKKQITEEQITELMQAFSRAEEVDKLRVEIEGLRAQLDERYIAMRVRQLEEALDVERQTARRLRAEIARLKQEPELLRAELIAITNAARKALADAYDRAREVRDAFQQQGP